jgi:hypothetical protein
MIINIEVLCHSRYGTMKIFLPEKVLIDEYRSDFAAFHR